MRGLRLLAFGWALQFKMLSRSAFDGVLGVMWPLFFATALRAMEWQSRRYATLEQR